MTHTNKQHRSIPLEWLSEGLIREICLGSGPFITVFLPTYHRGVPELSKSADLAGVIRQAEKGLADRRYRGSVDPLLEPLRALRQDEEDAGDHEGSVIYLNASGARRFRLSGLVTEQVIVATFPQVTPILSEFGPPNGCHVLALAKGTLRLGCWIDGKCIEVPLPEKIPLSFEDTLGSSRPDHDIQSRAPGSSAQGGATWFGTSTQRESVAQELHHYLQLVDRELGPVLNDAPLVVIAIDRELTEYRKVATYRNVHYAQSMSPEHHAWSELGEISLQALRKATRERASKALADFKEFPRRDLVTEDLRTALAAAREGCVQMLLVEDGAEEHGLLGPAFPLDDERLEGEHDLINAAAVKTIRTGGRVQTVEAGRLGRSRVGAVLRYAAANFAG